MKHNHVTFSRPLFSLLFLVYAIYVHEIPFIATLQDLRLFKRAKVCTRVSFFRFPFHLSFLCVRVYVHARAHVCMCVFGDV